MANDVANRSSVSGAGNVSNQTENNNSTSATDQQKVPPLRIVLNTGGNQRNSTTISTDNNHQHHQSSTKKSKHNNSQDAQNSKAEDSFKSKVRIKLGTTNKSTATTKSNSTEDNLNEDNSSSNFNHLRRITRRSQRTIQSINNEDEESISSMTSIDENLQNTTTELTAQDSELSSQVQATSAANSASNGSNLNNTETPRRHKRRKGEPSESQTLDSDTILGSQNYKVPDQNSIELYKNIRKQVDKRLRNLNSIHPKIPYGFRDYMLSRGAYLLNGNKLGNGTSLYLDESGGFNLPPVGKYHAIRQNRVNYTVPNRAKVPLGLPVNSPLYELFVDQEKERHRIRMQHIKEREKLTLAAEQEIIRVYNQAALTASNQTEPFSACTMLKHQEIYDYLNSEGKIILSRENIHQDQEKQDGVRTRRRQHGNISPNITTSSTSQSRKNSNNDEAAAASVTQAANKQSRLPAPSTAETNSTQPVVSTNTEITDEEKKVADNGDTLASSSKDFDEKKSTPGQNQAEQQAECEVEEKTAANQADKDESRKLSGDAESSQPAAATASLDDKLQDQSETKTISSEKGDTDVLVGGCNNKITEVAPSKDVQMEIEESLEESNVKLESCVDSGETKSTTNSENPKNCREISDQNSNESQSETKSKQENDTSSSVSDDDKRALNKELFLTQLQEVDDKWDKIRKEMLVRHENEAESLYAIQKLEWEWKTKEIGACDVRATPIIDSTLVPKLNIQMQDY